MPNFTTNLNLEKPLSNENYNIEVFNENADKLDTAIKEVSSKVDNFEAPVKSVNGKTGAVTLAAADIKTVDGKTLEQFKVDASSQLDTKANLVNGKVPIEELPSMDFIPISEKGAINGVAPLTNLGVVPLQNLTVSVGTHIEQTATGSIIFSGIDFTNYNAYEFYIESQASSSSSFNMQIENTPVGNISVSNSKLIKYVVYADGSLEECVTNDFDTTYSASGIVKLINQAIPRIRTHQLPSVINTIAFVKSSTTNTNSVTITAVPRRF